MSQDHYRNELTADREEIASILSAVADGIRTGAVRLGDSADAVTVDMPDELTLELELETEDGEMSLELEMGWPVSSDASPLSSIDATPENDEEITLLGTADASRSLARFEVYRARDEEWRWRLRHHNGNIIATSGEGYTRKHNAVKGLRSVIANSQNATITGEFTE